jgi:hypothetical protein
MSKDTVVLVIHGMGTFQAGVPTGALGDFGKSFITSINTALNRHKGHETEKIEDSIDIVEFNYSQFFDDARKKMADNATSVSKQLAAIGGLGNIEHLVGELSALDAQLKGEAMFYTHWLDVIFYTTLLGASVRASLAKKIAELVAKYDGSNVHIIAHSLGTAVLHDTLHLLYRAETDPTLHIEDLKLGNNKLNSIWMIANVARVLHKFTGLTDPYKSVVKPGDNGCCSSLANVHHEFDPFTLLAPFAPLNNGSWRGVAERDYNDFFQDIKTKIIVDKNTHSFTQYIEDPAVSIPMLYDLLDDFNADQTEIKKIEAAYNANSINSAYAVAHHALLAIKESNSLSWANFVQAGKALEKLKSMVI